MMCCLVILQMTVGGGGCVPADLYNDNVYCKSIRADLDICPALNGVTDTVDRPSLGDK